jgi:uncharacterized glyoxalase superfamily protein PhnB
MPEPNMFPFLRYEDAPGAIDWLVHAFGFEKHMVVPGDNGSMAHAQLKLGPGYVMIGTGSDQSGEIGKAVDDFRHIKQGIYVNIQDIDAHYQRARAAGADITREIENTEYGSREYSCRDVGGYYWSFGTYRPEEES